MIEIAVGSTIYRVTRMIAGGGLTMSQDTDGLETMQVGGTVTLDLLWEQDLKASGSSARLVAPVGTDLWAT